MKKQNQNHSSSTCKVAAVSIPAFRRGRPAVLFAMLNLFLLSGLASCWATTFTWTTLTGGNAAGSWTTQGNWNNTLPTAFTDVADFSTLDITANSQIGLTNANVAININSMIFGDTDTSTPAGWTLVSSGSAMSLALGGSNPTITVNALGTGAGVTNNVVMAGSGFTKAGPGLLALGGSNPNTFTGTTMVTNGTLVLKKSDNIVAIPGDLVVAAGATVLTTGKAQLASTANLTVNGTFDTGSKVLLVNSMVVDGGSGVNVILSSSSSVAITNATLYDLRSGNIAPNLAGTAALTKTTPGTVLLSNGGGANTFSGPILISDGILDVGHSGTGNGLPGVVTTITNTGVLRLQHDTEFNPAATVIVDSGTFELFQHNDAVGTVVLDHNGQILNGGNTSKTLTVSNNMDFRSGTCSSKLGGTGIMTKSTAGTVLLTLDNANTGGTLITGGILQLGDGIGGTRGQFGTGPVTNNSVIVLNHAGAFTVANIISGSGSLTNLAGSPSLTGASTYTGNTTVSGGTLFVNNTTGSGTGSSAVTIQSGATLGGTGVISGTVSVQSGANLAPGNTGLGSIGTLTINGSLTLGAGSANNFEVNGSTPANDSVAAGSSVTYGGSLNITPTGTFTAGQQFVLFSGAGAANASNFASLTGNPGANLAFSFTNGVLSVVSTGGGSPVLNMTQSGSTLNFSWSDPSFKLQSQTNNLVTGLNTNNWFDYPNGGTSPVGVTVDPSKPTVFFRLSQ
ncbi:MAG TPA: autotransporter-associated beta strand repeat-containing protein [Candidatus Acidoferrales bacterium]|jgi:fibronectin-binding autotransporter adhesin|nr:autotransporter-associated beta strand repeat-containing protein [Candidatus Acidoferrales bacterium]